MMTSSSSLICRYNRLMPPCSFFTGIQVVSDGVHAHVLPVLADAVDEVAMIPGMNRMISLTVSSVDSLFHSSCLFLIHYNGKT